MAAVATIIACTGDDPATTSTADSGANGDGASVNDSGSSGDGSVDAGADTSSSTCGTADTTPCNCGTTKSCCIGSGSALCFSRGSEDEADAASGCTSTSTLDCVANDCGGGSVCCFNGEVTPGTTCTKRMTSFDSRCIQVDASAVSNPCVDESNGAVHELLCAVDADCARFDAGACVPALMDTVKRVMKVCAR